MSQITDAILRYREGELTIEALAAEIEPLLQPVVRPTRTADQLGGGGWATDEERDYPQEGTWDEVTLARARALLTLDEMSALHREVDRLEESDDVGTPNTGRASPPP